MQYLPCVHAEIIGDQLIVTAAILMPANKDFVIGADIVEGDPYPVLELREIDGNGSEDCRIHQATLVAPEGDTLQVELVRQGNPVPRRKVYLIVRPT
ncbi:MAG: hypothetical protein SF053_02650 [Bacteroidia bacterium]|nr:hypothetical protein [Bacteroidia bacterium]